METMKPSADCIKMKPYRELSKPFLLKPNTNFDVKNPTKAINKGKHLKKGEHLKSEREKALKVRAKPMKVCGYCKEKTNEHTKTTCPKNPKARKKKEATPIY